MKTGHKEACPECGSKDNLHVYNDGGYHCFTPGCTHHKSSPEYELSVTEVIPYVVEKLHFQDFKSRGLLKDTLTPYGVGISAEKSAMVFPMFKAGLCVGIKYRLLKEKRFYWDGDTSVGLFGTQLANSKKELIITEGELDALSFVQALNNRRKGFVFGVVSVTKGAAGAAQCIKENIKWLEQFKHIHLCFDNDEPGQLALTECLRILPLNRVKVITLPNNYKDANDLVVDGSEEALIDALYRASTPILPGLLCGDKLSDLGMHRVFSDEINTSISTLVPQLDSVMRGFNPGDLITVYGGTGIGKTSFVQQLAINVIRQRRKVFFLPLEMSVADIVSKLTEMYIGMPLVSSVSRIINNQENRKKVAHAMNWVCEYLVSYEHIGAMNVDQLIRMIESAVLAADCKLVVIDHKDAVLTTGNSDWKQVDLLMARLKETALRLQCTILIVSHQSRDSGNRNDDQAHISLIRGSQGVAQYSDVVIGVSRKRDTDQLDISIDKQHRMIQASSTDLNFSLSYNKEKRRFNGIRSIEKSSGNTVTIQNRDKNEEPVRSGDTEQQPVPRIRNAEIQANLNQKLHTRFPTGNEVWETYIHRKYREDAASAQTENTCFEGTVFSGLEDLILLSVQESVQGREEPNVCGLGRKTQYTVVTRNKDTEFVEDGIDG